MIKLRLYGIRKVCDPHFIPDLFFSDLMKARKERDRLSNSTGEPHVVCNGPDNKHYRHEHA